MIVGIYGLQDSGKTRLVEGLAKALVKKGYTVASVKHTRQALSVDSEGKDTWRHWKAGSDPVVFSSEAETAIIKHSSSSADEIARLLRTEYSPDVIIIEGFKAGSFPKVSVGDIEPAKGTVLRNPSLAELVKFVEREVAAERVRHVLPGLDCGKCGLDCDGLARAIASGRKKLSSCRELQEEPVTVIVGGESVPMGRFASKIVSSTVRGMLGGLKGYVPGKDVEIRLGTKKTSTKRRSQKQ